jgi:phage terminase large subunit GpA-like protein
LDVVDKIVKYNFDADYWKLKVQEWLRTAPGKKGSLVFFRADHPNEHSQLSFHLAAEQLEDVQVPGKGLVKKWVKRGRNHWLDCAAMAAAALDYVGFRLVDVPEPEPEEHEADSADTGNWYARMRNAI